jgi:methyl-accepting chemotaxis protein
MTQKSAMQNLLVKISSILSVVFLALGLIFMFAAYFGAESNTLVSLLVMTFAALLAVISIVATNFSAYRMNCELKEAAAFASQISRGEISFDFEEYAEAEDASGELKIALRQISDYLAEKAAIADRVAAGDFSARVVPFSEADVFGNAFRQMIAKLGTQVQTEAERNRLRQTIHKLLTEVSEIAAGDLTVEAAISAEMTGAIAKAINSMTKELRSLIKQVKDVTFQVGNSASAINDTTEQLARGSEAQASQISRTTTAISGMAAQIQEVSDNALLSAQVAGDSLDNARYGKKAVQDNINAMNSIRSQVQETAKRIKKLGERSQEISQIVSLLNDLSERTGLLALNASLQAVSAGESSRGFAVVAEEVERLAERSNNLTQQIAKLAQTNRFPTVSPT